MLPVPVKYFDLVAAEQEKLGVYTYTEVMGRILAFYFDRHGHEEVKGGETEKPPAGSVDKTPPSGDKIEEEVKDGERDNQGTGWKHHWHIK